MSKRVLITGAQGFVGRYLAAHLLRSNGGVNIYGIGRSPRSDDAFTHSITWGTTSIPAPLPEDLKTIFCCRRYQYTSADLGDRAQLKRLLAGFRPQVVFHLAAALRDDTSEHLFRTNLEGTIHLIEAIAESGIKKPRLIIGSTGGVYGVPVEDGLPITEDAPCMPIDLYSISKLAAEQSSQVLVRQNGIPTIWARLFNLVGPGQDERHSCGKFASAVAAMVKAGAPRMIEVGALDTTRDFVEVRDAGGALRVLAERGDVGETYNIGSGVETSVKTVLHSLLRAADLAGLVEIKRGPDRPQDIQRHFASIDRLKALGYQPQYPLSQSIKDLFQYYVQTVNEKAAELKPSRPLFKEQGQLQ
jgi:nucleoside-diphosphate-sugar epimerase